MPYRFVTEQQDYSDLASGRVLYSLPGHPAFPVRLADEILQRCLAIRQAEHLTGPCTLYDPCCGAAYHLSVLAYLHRSAFREIIGSDIDQKAIELAQKNLSLISLDGMDQRIGDIQDLLQRYGKESHQEALASAHRLREGIARQINNQPFKMKTFQANALDKSALSENLKGILLDLVFVDVPYGAHSQWHDRDSNTESGDPMWRMLEALSAVLTSTSIVAVVSDKGQKAAHAGYRRSEQFQVGKRRISILRPTSSR